MSLQGRTLVFWHASLHIHAERSLPYTKVIQVSAMKIYFQIAERSLPYTKVSLYAMKTTYFHEILSIFI